MRRIAAATVATLAVLGPAGTARADAATPTDYRTTVVAVTPPTDTIAVDVIGGDAFLELTADPGTNVVVLGYQGEPYLRFRADGAVMENQRSPTTYLNESRYGDSAPPGADPALPADWEQVGSGGRYAWHDHRAHWMSREPPELALPGDRILRADVPMRVDGVDVSVEVATDWLPRPSRVPLYVGAGIAAGLIAVAVVLRRRLAWVLLAGAVAAAGIGWWEYASLPAETGPLSVWWLLPTVAAVSAVLALALGYRMVSYAFVLLGALELGAWVVIRRDGAFRAVIPTDAPFWLDRGVLAAAAAVAVAAAVAGVVGLYRASTGDTRA
jgi:hypothetical protein